MADYKKIVPIAQSGDPKALEELYKNTSRAVYFTCLSFVKNEQDAEDLTQNTYITAFKKLKTLQQPEKFEPWIKRIAVNLCKDFLIKKGTHPTQPLDEQGYDEPVDENFLPEEYITAAEKRSIVMQIMRESLSDVLYQTVIMFYFDEMSVATIAEEMNCPEGTVKYRLNAARAKIKQGVLDYERKNGDKLYAFVGLPFLARLLIEESKAASVPALDIMSVMVQNAPYVPDSAAVDPGFSANTATRIGGKMLGTLKAKIIAGAIAAAVVGGGTAAVVAVANHTPDDSGYTSRTESTGSGMTGNNTSDNEPESSGSDIDDSKQQFWFAKQTWTEAPRKTFEGGLLIDNRKTIDPEFLNDICAPYHCILLNTERHNADRFSDVLMAEEDIPAYNYADIYTQYVFGEPYPEFSGVDIIRVFNLDNIPHSLYDCYENGWWKITVDENYSYLPVTAALGLPRELIDKQDPSENALLDAMIEKFGTPHYIYYPQVYRGSNNPDRRAAIYEDMESILNPVPGNEMFFIQYQFVYELENDIVMCVYISEKLNDDGGITLNVEFAEFWSGACWENRNAVSNLDYDTDEIELFKVYP